MKFRSDLASALELYLKMHFAIIKELLVVVSAI